MAFTEAFAAFFDTDGFAVVATIAGASVNVIFDAAYADVLGIVAGTAPTLLAASADITAASAAVGSSVVISGTTYTIAEIQPDGTGLTRLMLKT